MTKSKISLCIWFCIFSLISAATFAEGENPIRYSVAFNFLQDLSDTYKGGSLLNVEIAVVRNWYGGSISVGYFQNQSNSFHQITIEEPSEIFIDIPYEEMAIMKTTAISGLIIPVQSKRFAISLQTGVCLNISKWLMMKEVTYSYDLNEQKFTSLTKDYQLIKRNHLGYQVGIDLSFFFTKRVGFEISSRIQSLHNGGSFFFVGGGFCFNL